MSSEHKKFMFNNKDINSKRNNVNNVGNSVNTRTNNYSNSKLSAPSSKTNLLSY